MGLRRVSCSEPVLIPQGEHTLQFVVGNEAGIPALPVESETISSNESWEPTGFDGTWGPAAA